MSFNIGSGLLTAHISEQKLQTIKDNPLPPNMSLWEKIKDFFFSTHQQAALNCIHKLYHHAEFKMSEQDIHKTFIELKNLASPGCRNKFTLDRNCYRDTYQIDSEIILSLPRGILYHDGDIFYDCQDDEWFDCKESAPSSSQTQEGDSDMSSWDQITHSSPELRTQTPADMPLSDDHSYIQSIKYLIATLETHFNRIGIKKIIMDLGVMKIPSLIKIRERINTNLNDSVTDNEMLKKDIESLLKIPGLRELIPVEVTKQPEFSFILNYGISH